MATYNVSVGGLPQASDVNQLVDIFNGKHDVGTITFAPQISAPSTSGFSLTGQSGSTLGVGAYNYVFTLVTGYYKSDGTLVKTGETTASSALSFTTTTSNTTIKITLPTSGFATSAVAINIYRTAVGGSTYGIVATVKIGNASYTDSTADGSRGSAPPSSNTTGTTLNVGGGVITTGSSSNMYVYGQSVVLQTLSAAGIVTLRNSSGVSLLTANSNDSSVKTKNNTVDDGAGNMTVSGTINVQNATAQSWIGGLRFIQSGGINYIESYSANNSGSTSATLKLTGASGAATTVQTGNNTLDDGNGNITINGYIIANSGIYSYPQGTATSTNNYGSNTLNFRRSTWNGSAAALGTSYFQLNSSGALIWYNESSVATLGIYQGGQLYSYKNTLDDGSGSMTVNGTFTVAPNATATSAQTSYSSRVHRFQNSTWNGSAAVTNYRDIYIDGSGNFQFTGYSGGTGVASIDTAGNATFSGTVTGTGTYGTVQVGAVGCEILFSRASANYFKATSAGGFFAFNTNGDTVNTLLVNADHSVKTVSNILDDGNGNMTIAGNLRTVGTASVKFDLNGSTANAFVGNLGSSTGTKFGFSKAGQALLTADIVSNAINTANNTLDDGSGSMTLNGYLNVQGPQSGAAIDSNPIVLRAWNGSAAVGAHLKASHSGGWFSSNYADTVVTFTVSDTGAVQTVKNTLDDGNGNMVIHGSTTINTAGVPFIFNESDQTGATGYWRLAVDGGAWRIDRNTATARDLSTYSTGLQISQSGALTSQSNTLDDGSGNMTASGVVRSNASQSFASWNGSTFVSQSGFISGANSVFNGSAANDAFMRNESNGNILFGFKGASGTESPALKLSYNGGANKAIVSTQHNTLDDGAGNMTVAGTVSTNSSLSINATSTHLVFKNGGTTYWHQETTSTTSNAWNLVETGVANRLKVAKGGQITSTYNTLDDGSGKMEVAGNLGLGGITPQYGLHQIGGSARIQALSNPAAPTVTPIGTTGTTSYTYYVYAIDRNGNKSLASAGGTTTTGNATLSGTNYNKISWSAVNGAVSYDICKGQPAGPSLATNYIGTTINDTGQATTAYTAPSRNNTADLTVDGILTMPGMPTEIVGVPNTFISVAASVETTIPYYGNGTADWSNGTWTCPATGDYLFIPNVYLNITNGYAYINAYKNGSSIYQVAKSVNTTANTYDDVLHGPVLIQCNAGDTVKFTLYNTSTSNNVNWGHTICSTIKVT